MEIQGGKYLTFILGTEEYGIPIRNVKEIIGIMDITDIPRTPGFIKGVINLRGKIILVMDLRLKFGLEEKEYSQRTCIIVVEVSVPEGKRQVGIVVDTVSEVQNIQRSEIETPADYDLHLNRSHLLGMGKVKGKVILLLDIEKIVSQDEMALVREGRQEE